MPDPCKRFSRKRIRVESTAPEGSPLPIADINRAWYETVGDQEVTRDGNGQMIILKSMQSLDREHDQQMQDLKIGAQKSGTQPALD